MNHGILAATLGVALLATPLCLAAPPTAKKPDLGKPKPFFLHLCKLSKGGTADKWAEQLSERKRKKGPEYVKRHFEIWSQQLREYVRDKLDGDPTKAEVTLVPRGKRLTLRVTNTDPAFAVTVIRAGGRLLIDEN